MFLFDPNLSLEENYQRADSIDFAAWDFAGYEHREAFRDSGQFKERSASLTLERCQLLKEALAQGQLAAYGIAKGDPTFEIVQIHPNAFLLDSLEIDWNNSQFKSSGFEFQNVRICRKDGKNHPSPVKAR
jgi:hypothetical protein